MSDELRVIREVTTLLHKLNIKYMITGSIAANYYSTPRMTRDIDIVIELQDNDALKISKAFENDYYIDADAITDAIQSSSMFNIIHNKLQVKVDFICLKNSEYRKQEFQRKKEIDIDGFSIWIVTIEDLILSKLDWAKESRSEIQLKDVVNLVKDNPNIDKDYLKRWAETLGVNTLLEEVLL